MNNQNLEVVSAEQIAKNGMILVNSGKIRNHKLKSSSRIHTGEVENKEHRIYRDFLSSKNCCIVVELTGNNYHK